LEDRKSGKLSADEGGEEAIRRMINMIGVKNKSEILDRSVVVL
jgi:hypothetical protein